MIKDFKILNPNNAFETAECEQLWCNSYYMFIIKEKLHASLICIFHHCLVNKGLALKVA